MEDQDKAKVIGGVGIGMVSSTAMVFLLSMVLKNWGKKTMIIPLVLGLLLIGVGASKGKKDGK